MSKKTILFLSGLADDSQPDAYTDYIKGDKSDPQGNMMLYNYIPETEFQKMHILLDTSPDQEVTLPEFDAIFNLITDADTHKLTLSKIDSLYQSLQDKLPFINLPSNVLKTSRTSLHSLFSNIKGLYVPKTVLLTSTTKDSLQTLMAKEALNYPIIMRSVNSRQAPILLSDKNYSLTPDNSHYTITEFIPYLLNGYYRKERLLVVAGEVFLADVQFSDIWYITDQNTIENAETDVMRQNISRRFDKEIKPHIQTVIEKLYRTTGLDYFSIDCHINEKKELYLFSFNPNADIFNIDRTNPFAIHLMHLHKKLLQMIESKL